MKKLLPVLLFACGLGTGASQAQTESVKALPSPAAEAKAAGSAPEKPDCLDCHGEEGDALRKLEQEWAAATVQHDAAAIERIEADEFTCTDPSGAVTRRQDDLDAAKSGSLKVTDFKLEDTKVNVYGNTAVVTGKSTFSGTAYDQPISGTFRWTDVWVKRGGRWQAVASQATTVAPTSTENSRTIEKGG